MGASSLNRNPTWAPCIESMESHLPDHQGSPFWLHTNLGSSTNALKPQFRVLSYDCCPSQLNSQAPRGTEMTANSWRLLKCPRFKSRKKLVFPPSNTWIKQHRPSGTNYLGETRVKWHYPVPTSGWSTVTKEIQSSQTAGSQLPPLASRGEPT